MALKGHVLKDIKIFLSKFLKLEVMKQGVRPRKVQYPRNYSSYTKVVTWGLDT